MRIVCWASALIVIGAACSDACRAAGEKPQSVTASVVRSATEHGQTRVDVQLDGGRRASMLLARDADVAAGSDPVAVTIVGVLPAAAIVLVDTYRSTAGGLSQCQAGEERFLRVVSLAEGNAAQTFALKVASCRTNLELGDPGIEWDTASRTVRVHWLTGPSGAPETRAIRIDTDGSVHPAASSGSP